MEVVVFLHPYPHPPMLVSVALITGDEKCRHPKSDRYTPSLTLPSGIAQSRILSAAKVNRFRVAKAAQGLRHVTTYCILRPIVSSTAESFARTATSRAVSTGINIITGIGGGRTSGGTTETGNMKKEMIGAQRDGANHRLVVTHEIQTRKIGEKAAAIGRILMRIGTLPLSTIHRQLVDGNNNHNNRVANIPAVVADDGKVPQRRETPTERNADGARPTSTTNTGVADEKMCTAVIPPRTAAPPAEAATMGAVKPATEENKVEREGRRQDGREKRTF